MVEVFLKKVEIKGVVLTIISALMVTLIWGEERLPLSLILGSALGLLNIRWTAKVVKGLLTLKSPTRAKKVLLFIYLLKLGIISLFLILLLKKGLINAIALLAGLTLTVAVLLIEGVLSVRRSYL